MSDLKEEINDRVKDVLNRKKLSIQSELDRIQIIEKSYKWVLTELPFEYHHKDIRGGNTIILGTSLDNLSLVDQDKLESKFKNSDIYRQSKEHLISFGYAKNVSNNTLYMYIQSNKDLLERCYSIDKIKDVMVSRSNRELFPHINGYFK